MTRRPKPPSHADLLEDIAVLSRQIKIEDRVEEFGKSLTFEPSLARPIHRWMRFKEGFSQDLVATLFDEYLPKRARRVSLLDPFCGVGTSLLAGETLLGQRGIESARLCGVEVNPFMHFVSTTKLAWRDYNPAFIRRAANVASNGMKTPRKPTVPTLSTFNDDRFISRQDLTRLLELRDKARVVAKGRKELRPLLLGIVAGAERVFNLRKDGRALRYSPKDVPISVDAAVQASWDTIIEDLQGEVRSKRAAGSTTEVRRGDGRRSDRIFSKNAFNMVLFSPPYLNNIDYTEVYKIEQWLLEFLTTSKGMVEQRRKTFRSHPSCIFPSPRDARIAELVDDLGDRFKRLLAYASEDAPWRYRLFGGYFADMRRTLDSCLRLLKPGGRVFLVVGNSIHGTADAPVPVATDLWCAHIARRVGLHVDGILIGRHLARSRTSWDGARESIVVLSRPGRNGK
jgi:SAM-dependent methyltransferase